MLPEAVRQSRIGPRHARRGRGRRRCHRCLGARGRGASPHLARGAAASSSWRTTGCSTPRRLISPSGELVETYRKVHLFDVQVEGAGTHESEVFAAGGEVVLHAIDAVAVGMTTCYDLRFPELFRVLALRGVEVISMPSAFTAATGAPHWEPLVRAARDREPGVRDRARPVRHEPRRHRSARSLPGRRPVGPRAGRRRHRGVRGDGRAGSRRDRPDPSGDPEPRRIDDPTSTKTWPDPLGESNARTSAQRRATVRDACQPCRRKEAERGVRRRPESCRGVEHGDRDEDGEHGADERCQRDVTQPQRDRSERR